MDEYHLEVWRDGAWRPVGGAASLDYCLGRISERWSSPGPRLAMRCVSNDGSVIDGVKAREDMGYGIGGEHLSSLEIAAAAIRMLEDLGIGGGRAAGLMALIEGDLREMAKQCKPPSEPLLPALASLDGDALAEWLGERGLEAPHWGSAPGDSSGRGDGTGSGYGRGEGSGYGTGKGEGRGSGWGDGDGSGDGTGGGYGWGDGPGWGDGTGYGRGGQ